MATAEHVAFAWRAIESAFAAGAAASAAPDDEAAAAAAAAAAAPASFARAESPFFVSISNGATLRGCLGSLNPLSLLQLHDFARRTAFADARFLPLEASELPSSTVTVSLLHSHEAGASADDWILGLHGITIEFASASGGALRGTYLPYVAPENGWSKAETVRRLVRKAGHGGSVESVMPSLRLTRFCASVVSMSYVEFSAYSAAAAPGK